MRKLMVFAVVLSLLVGCGCGDDDETFEDAGTNGSQANLDSGATEEDAETTSDAGMDATNDQRVDIGFDATTVQTPPTLQDLNGTWIGGCYEQGGDILNINVIVLDGKMNSQIGMYDNGACQNRLMFIDIEMSISIPDPPESSKADGAYRLVFEVKAVTGTVTVEEAIKVVNEAELFGFSDWKVGEPKAIDGRSFSPSDDDAGVDGNHLPEIGVEGEFIFRLNVFRNQLQISDLGAGSLPNDVYTKR